MMEGHQIYFDWSNKLLRCEGIFVPLTKMMKKVFASNMGIDLLSPKTHTILLLNGLKKKDKVGKQNISSPTDIHLRTFVTTGKKYYAH
jgi:hypothetical protein